MGRSSGYRSASKRDGLKQWNETALALDDPQYLTAKEVGMKLFHSAVLAEFTKHHLDAMIYPTSSVPAQPIQAPDVPA